MQTENCFQMHWIFQWIFGVRFSLLFVVYSFDSDRNWILCHSNWYVFGTYGLPFLIVLFLFLFHLFCSLFCLHVCMTAQTRLLSFSSSTRRTSVAALYCVHFFFFLSFGWFASVLLHWAGVLGFSSTCVSARDTMRRM